MINRIQKYDGIRKEDAVKKTEKYASYGNWEAAIICNDIVYEETFNQYMSDKVKDLELFRDELIKDLEGIEKFGLELYKLFLDSKINDWEENQ